MGTNAALRVFQSGIEVASTHGTLVAATSKLAVKDITFTPLDVFDRPALAKGLIIRHPGNETVIMRGTKFTIPETPCIYDQIQTLLAMSVKGAVAAVGGGAPFTWTYTRDITADPAIDTRTIERRLSDGTNFIDNRWGYAFLSDIHFNWKPDQALTISADGYARRIQSNALTAAQAFPTIEIPAAALAQVWIDSTWATLGSTQVVAQMLAAHVSFKTGYKPKMSLDGRSDLDFTTHIIDAKDVGLDVTLRMLIKANSGQFATEKTAAEAGTLRAVRLKVAGTASRYLQLDMLLKHEPASLQVIGTEEGQDIVEMKLVDATDATNLFSAIVSNTVNTVV